jgi:hypothetical protein
MSVGLIMEDALFSAPLAHSRFAPFACVPPLAFEGEGNLRAIFVLDRTPPLPLWERGNASALRDAGGGDGRGFHGERPDCPQKVRPMLSADRGEGGRATRLRREC